MAVIYSATRSHLKKHSILRNKDKKGKEKCKGGRRKDKLASETPNFDRAVIASRDDFIFRQADAAHSSFVPNQGTVAALFVPGPHLELSLLAQLCVIDKKDQPLLFGRGCR